MTLAVGDDVQMNVVNMKNEPGVKIAINYRS